MARSEHVEVGYDPKADALYLRNPRLRGNERITGTVVLGESVNVDYSGDRVVGIEVLNASAHIPDIRDITRVPAKRVLYAISALPQ